VKIAGILSKQASVVVYKTARVFSYKITF